MTSSVGCWIIGDEGSASWRGRPKVQRKLTSEKVIITMMMREGVKRERMVAVAGGGRRVPEWLSDR